MSAAKVLWDQIEPTAAHKAYTCLALFLVLYTLYATFIRNRLHLSEPPIALVLGIIYGPAVLGWLQPNLRGVDGPLYGGDETIGGWGWGDDITQELMRVAVGYDVFAAGVELPRFYAGRHWKSVGMLLGPVMTFGWVVCGALAMWLFKINWANAAIIAACLSPTDPVLAASILSNSQFSERVPVRIKNLLSAESGCNDGISFPFLYVGLFALTNYTAKGAVKDFFLITLLWQCAFGTIIGIVIGWTANKTLRWTTKKEYMDDAGLTVFYLLLPLLSVGIASILGTDDFLVCFGAGYGFARDGWFSKKTEGVHLPKIIDLILNSTMFVYLGTIMPFHAYNPHDITPYITVPRLLAFTALVLLFRRIPIVLAVYRWIPDIRTFSEALFCGHFGPMGLGGVFLAMEARAWLENGSSVPERHPPRFGRPYTNREKAIYHVWPVVSFIVMCSTLVHGLSVLVMSIYSHLNRPRDQRAPFFAAETDPLQGMVHDEGDGRSIESLSLSDNED